MKRKVEAFLAQNLPQGVTLLLAVSGGADSMAMLDVCVKLSHEMDFSIEVAHIHHHLRTASDDEWTFVEAACARYGVPFHGRHLDVVAYAKAKGRSMEAAAHDLRYQALEDIMHDCGACAIALAHHANDRAETMLMNILRGTTVGGLATMKAVSGVYLRPLLGVSRAEIEAYCAAKAIHYVTDESNFDTTIQRNRIRHELLPLLESYNPQIVAALARLGESSEREADYIKQEVQVLMETARYMMAPTWSLFYRAPLEAAHDAILAAFLREMVQAYAHGRSPLRYDQVERALSLIKDGHGHYDIGGGIVLECTHRYVFMGSAPQGEWIKEGDTWRHHDLDAVLTLEEDMIVRVCQAGDAIRLKNLGQKSLKKVFQESALPQALRKVWPVVIDTKTKDVIWVPFLAQTAKLGYYKDISHFTQKVAATLAQQIAQPKQIKKQEDI